MSENHVAEQLSDSGPQSNGVTESNTDDAYQDQVPYSQLSTTNSMEMGIMPSFNFLINGGE